MHFCSQQLHTFGFVNIFPGRDCRLHKHSVVDVVVEKCRS